MNSHRGRGPRRRLAAIVCAATLGSAAAFAAQQSRVGSETQGIQIAQFVRPRVQAPVRPDNDAKALLGAPPQNNVPQVVHGEIRLGSVRQAFKGATLVVTLERTIGPPVGAVAQRIAELRLFNVNNTSPDQNTSIPFSIGDFIQRPKATYTLQCYIDINQNNERDVGDFWNERQVEVFSAQAPPMAIIEDFARVGGGA